MKLFISSCNFKENENIDGSSLVYRIPCVQFENNGWKIASIKELPILTLGNIERLFGAKPSVILIWMCGTYVNNNKPFLWRIRKYKFNIKTYWYIDDIHNNTKNRAKLFNYFDLILNSYAYCFNMFYGRHIKTYWFPHYVNEKLLNDISYNENPTEKIFLSGQVTENIYPARHKALLLAKNNDKIDCIGHPGYNDRNKHIYCGSKYYSLINTYLAAFTCCAKKDRPYIVAKFFEFIASGTLLIAYDEHVKQELNKLGFIDKVNYISCTLENMQQVFDYVLDPCNRKEIDTIRRNGFELSKQNAYLCNRVKSFCEYIEV
ncbi:hypothetical protein N9064_01260 [bacterium]|nr:hypothetical protein [bacterium]